jgi:hypothetical protein
MPAGASGASEASRESGAVAREPSPVPAAERPAQAGPSAPALAPPAPSGFAVHASWNDRLVVESEDKRLYLQPIAILQGLFALPINPAGKEVYEGIGFTFRRAALGFDARMLGSVRTFFLSNIANGTLTLWDYFVDLDFLDGRMVPRVGRFRPWQGRQRLLAGDRYQMIQLPAAMTDLLDFGDGRDLGAGIFGLLPPRGGSSRWWGWLINPWPWPVEYAVGIWNGEVKYSNDPVNGPLLGSSDLRSRGNIDFEFGGRVVHHPFGYLPALDESDYDISKKPRLSIGASWMLAKRHDVRAPYAGYAYFDDRVFKLGVELDFRWRGFSLEAEAFWRKAWLLSGTNDTGRKQFEQLGLGALGKSAYLQSGYFVVARLLELTGRFDYVDVEPATPGYILRPAGGINVFLHGYNLLVQVMYRANIGVGFDKDGDFWRSLRPSERTDLNLGFERSISRVTHDVFLMLQTSL